MCICVGTHAQVCVYVCVRPEVNIGYPPQAIFTLFFEIGVHQLARLVGQHAPKILLFTALALKLEYASIPRFSHMGVWDSNPCLYGKHFTDPATHLPSHYLTSFYCRFLHSWACVLKHYKRSQLLVTNFFLS